MPILYYFILSKKINIADHIGSLCGVELDADHAGLVAESVGRTVAELS